MERLDYRTLDEQSRHDNRKRAISLIKSGVKKGKVAEIMGVNPNAISEWVKRNELTSKIQWR